jgi:hypothetical protein
MFCPNCGKGEQAPDSYCRSCGEFLTDYSAKSYIINRLLGGSGPRSQAKINLVINMATVLASALLLGFLKGHYDALNDRTGEQPPRVIYFVYAFLLLNTAWQVLGFVINSRLLKKMAAAKKGVAPADPDAGEDAPPARSTQRSLPDARPPADDPESVTQHTTKRLDKVPRK